MERRTCTRRHQSGPGSCPARSPGWQTSPPDPQRLAADPAAPAQGVGVQGSHPLGACTTGDRIANALFCWGGASSPRQSTTAKFAPRGKPGVCGGMSVQQHAERVVATTELSNHSQQLQPGRISASLRSLEHHLYGTSKLSTSELAGGTTGRSNHLLASTPCRLSLPSCGEPEE